MSGHEICSPGQKCPDRDRPPDKRPKFVRTDVKNSKKIKIRSYTSAGAKKQVVSNVCGLQ